MDGDDDVLILDIIAIPELHSMMGTSETVFNGLNKAWGNDRAIKWAESRGIIRSEYRGGKFEGNQTKTLLEKSSDLEASVPPHLTGFARCLAKFNEVRLACFGQDLKPGYKERITEFHQAFLCLGLNVTPKVHAVIVHIPQFCDKTGKGLGYWSEQASESVHSDFKLTNNRFKVNQAHPDHPEKMLRAVVKYNSSHI